MATVDPTVKVSCADPPGEIVVGLGATVTPVGNPEATRVMESAYPPKIELETVEFPDEPCCTDAAVAERLKPEVGVAAVRAEMRPEFGLPHPVVRS